MRTRILFYLVFRTLLSSALQAQVLADINAIDPGTLNPYILEEINKIRKKVKADPLETDSLLRPASDDHAQYMALHKKLTHFQSSAIKKPPKNRVDYYGSHFAAVGENVQFTHPSLVASDAAKRKKEKQTELTYQQLAEHLVTNWKNSPPHYKNMITPEFKTTYTSVEVGEDGKIYACQLFGSSSYTYPDSVIPSHYPYKPQKDCKCRRVNKKPPVVTGVMLQPDSTLVLFSDKGRLVKRRIRNRNTSGFAADIVLKSQYTCNDDNRFNGMNGVRGIPLDPVFTKDFRKGKNFVMPFRFGFAEIALGKLPAWVNEEYEVNVTVVKRKRTCMNMYFEVMPLGFQLRFDIPFAVDTVALEFSRFHYDTLEINMYYAKGDDKGNPVLLDSLAKIIESNQSVITGLRIDGYASIEGDAGSNERLYRNRARVISDFLEKYRIDTALILISARENFDDFRRDIQNTAHAPLASLPDADIKRTLEDKSLSSELEPILKNHRYARLTLCLRHEEKIAFDRETTQQSLQHYINKGRIAEAKQMQSVEFGLAMRGDLSLSDFDNVKIPLEKRYLWLLNNRAVMKYYLDSANPQSLYTLREELEKLYLLDSSNVKIATNLAVIQFKQFSPVSLNDIRRYYFRLERKRNIDPRIKARMLLNLGVGHDWWLYMQKGFRARGRFLINLSKKHIRPARLTAEETFDIAGYYVFYRDEKFAFTLTKGLLAKTGRLEDLLFFLKLIHMTNLTLPRQTYLRLFKKIRQLSGAEFCTLFNSPAINFQIFDDLEIKDIYCEQCAAP